MEHSEHGDGTMKEGDGDGDGNADVNREFYLKFHSDNFFLTNLRS